jgi:hypothetical protein
LRGLKFSRRHLLKRGLGVKRRLFGYGDKVGSGLVELLPAARRAGLEGVEKSLPAPSQHGTTERDAGMLLLHLRPAPSHRWSSWLVVLAARRPGRGRRLPPQARPGLPVHDLDIGGRGSE